MNERDAAAERARLAAVHASGLVNLDDHHEFDDLAKLASVVAGVEIAAITLVEEDREVYLGREGLDGRENKRSASFCTYTIQDPECVMEVRDALEDDRFRNHEAVVGDLGVRYYFGVPLVDDDGSALGALCVVDRQPRSLTDQQKASLVSIAGAVTNTMRLLRRNRELRETTEELAIARDRAMMAFVTKQRFLTTVSHEVRTPLNGIIGVTGLLRSTGLTVEGEHFLDMILQAAESLAAMCDGVLADAQTETDEMMPMESAPLVDLIEEIVALHRPLYTLRGGDLKFDPLEEDEAAPYVWDAAALRRALGGLLRDATPGASAPCTRISVEPLSHDERHAEIRISVTVGAEGRVPAAFSVSAQQSCLAFASRYAGSFGTYADSTGDLHAWIHARLPLMQRPAATPEVGSRTFRAEILVVEDHAVNALVLTAMLERLGCRAVLAQNGREGVAIALERRFDAIMMDIQMPEMDGIEATRVIRMGRGANRRTPIIAVTASALDSDRVAASAVGMDDFVTKPVRPGMIEAVLERVLGQFPTIVRTLETAPK